MPKESSSKIMERPPIIAVLGHIDHGKSSLLDYIRKTNIVEREVGGITQRLSAYEVAHKTNSGQIKKITFLDTPGHEAFSGMRGRGAEIADIAILIVSAEDSVKAQTIEALKTIRGRGIPFIVAINKIDKPAANTEKVKIDLAEKEVYLEGFGGDIPCVLISAKTGAGIPELLDMILLVAEIGEFKADSGASAEGMVIESHLDSKRGLTATLIIKNGTLKKGEFVVSGNSFAPVRIMENNSGESIGEASFSAPVSITGWNELPSAGMPFYALKNKKEAEERAYSAKISPKIAPEEIEAPAEGTAIVPILLKAETAGALEAAEKEIAKIKVENVLVKIAQKGVGSISESDVKLSLGVEGVILLGFGVKADKQAVDLADRSGIKINLFDIIYKLTEWLEEEIKNRKPKITTEEIAGSAKILKCFSKNRDRQVVGGKVLSGKITVGVTIKIMRRDVEIGQGEIMELQQQKTKTREVEEGTEFGMMVEAKTEIAPGDVLEAVVLVTK